MSILINDRWYLNENSNSIQITDGLQQSYPNTSVYNFICIANNSVGGDQKLGYYSLSGNYNPFEILSTYASMFIHAFYAIRTDNYLLILQLGLLK